MNVSNARYGIFYRVFPAVPFFGIILFEHTHGSIFST